MKETFIYIFIIISMMFGSFFTTGCSEDFKYSKDYSVYDGVTLGINMADDNGILNLNLVNNTYMVRVNVTPRNVRINSQEFLYEIEDETVATIDENGLLTMKKEGETKLTVKLAVRPEIATSCTLDIRPVVVNKLHVPEQIVVKQGKTKDITEEISVMPSIANYVLNYHVEDESVATISEEGMITAVKEGNTIITVSTTDGSNISETINLTVEGKKYITEIQLPENEINNSIFKVGDNFDIGANTKILPEDAEEPTVVYSVKTGADIVSITPEGVLSCNKVGSAVILAEAQDGSEVTKEMTVNVYNGNIVWGDSRSTWSVEAPWITDGSTGKSDHILDGKNNTFLSIRKPEYPNAPNKEIYFIVDTKAKTKFNMIYYEHRHQTHYLAANKIEISGSDDGSTFTLIRGEIETPFNVNEENKYIHEIKIRDSEYRYIKVKVTDWVPFTGGITGTAISIAEFNTGTVN